MVSAYETLAELNKRLRGVLVDLGGLRDELLGPVSQEETGPVAPGSNSLVARIAEGLDDEHGLVCSLEGVVAELRGGLGFPGRVELGCPGKVRPSSGVPFSSRV